MGKVIEKKEVEQKPLMPFVSLDEAVAFDPNNPETQTVSPFLNAVLEAMSAVRPSTMRNVAHYLDIDERALSCAMRIATGYTYLEFRYRVILRKLEMLKEDHKHIFTDKIAQELGFADRTSLNKFLNNEKTQKALEKEGPTRHAKPCPGRQKFG